MSRSFAAKPVVPAAVDSPDLPGVVEFWDAYAPTYDLAVDHGLGDAAAREAWAALLSDWFPDHPAAVLDLGCGTGSLSRLALDGGHAVTGIDLSAAMVDLARVKCPEPSADFHVGDASDPAAVLGRGVEVPPTVDVVLARHLLWALPDPEAALACWVSLVRPGGRLVLVEGRWWGNPTSDPTPYAAGTEKLPWRGGVAVEVLTAALDPLVDRLEVHCLTHRPELWGRELTDERYAVVARLPG